jgi:hypothetical protein
LAACVTVNVSPAIVSVPMRGPVVEFAAALKLTLPAPVPELPPVIESHPTSALADQAHPDMVVTVIEPVPPAAGTG